MELNELEEVIGYTFKDKSLLQKAMTLSSFDGHCNNQSLECLGDAVLGFVVAEKYYLLDCHEGEITQMKKVLISDNALTLVSEKLGLDKALIRGKGDDNNKKAVPSAYEALVAAMYIDGGMEVAKKFVLATLDFNAKVQLDYISQLQELVQARSLPAPTYEKIECGTPQEPYFIAIVNVFGISYKGSASSYSLAKKLAAQSAYESIKSQNI